MILAAIFRFANVSRSNLQCVKGSGSCMMATRPCAYTHTFHEYVYSPFNAMTLSSQRPLLCGLPSSHGARSQVQRKAHLILSVR